jgi:hypothetical protein
MTGFNEFQKEAGLVCEACVEHSFSCSAWGYCLQTLNQHKNCLIIDKYATRCWMWNCHGSLVVVVLPSQLWWQRANTCSVHQLQCRLVANDKDQEATLYRHASLLNDGRRCNKQQSKAWTVLQRSFWKHCHALDTDTAQGKCLAKMRRRFDRFSHPAKLRVH